LKAKGFLLFDLFFILARATMARAGFPEAVSEMEMVKSSIREVPVVMSAEIF
jgi:hypothetical protein